MANAPSKQQPEWLAALRDPILGDLILSPCIVASEHIAGVLKAFGRQRAPARRRIVIALDEMAIKLWLARKYKAPKKFAAANTDLKALEDAARKMRGLWRKARPYYDALLKAIILTVPPKERRGHSFDFSKINAGPALDNLLPVIEALRTPDIYGRAFSQPPSSRKSLERALLWEPLFDLLRDFKIEEFGKHQAVIETVRGLHRACGVRLPDPIAVRQALKEWREHER
jgi:hypothetical protein